VFVQSRPTPSWPARPCSSTPPFASSVVRLRCSARTSGMARSGITIDEEPVPAGRKYQPVRAPRGTDITCKGWQQEAALRMLMNNLDPEVAERPEELIIYGGTGKAARNWQCYHAIVESLKGLAEDETLLVQSGKPVGAC